MTRPCWHRAGIDIALEDLLMEGIHFDLSFMPFATSGLQSGGRECVGYCSDERKPKQILVGLGLSNRFSVEAIDALYSGIKQACENYQVDLVGGDTTSSASGLVISMTVLGTAPKEKVVYRSGAQNNDIICVTGDLGGAYMGLQVLEQRERSFKS